MGIVIVDRQIYTVKGCPHCGAKPVLTKLREGRDSAFAIDCSISHGDFITICQLSVERFRGTEVPDVPKLALFSSEETIQELVAEWNSDHDYFMLGADPERISSRGSFEITLNTK